MGCQEPQALPSAGRFRWHRAEALGREKRHSQTGKRGHHLHAGVPKCFPHGAPLNPHGVLGFGTMTGSSHRQPRPEQGRRLESLPCSLQALRLLHLPPQHLQMPHGVSPAVLSPPSLLSRPATQPAPRSVPVSVALVLPQSALGSVPSPAYTLTPAVTALNRGGMS